MTTNSENSFFSSLTEDLKKSQDSFSGMPGIVPSTKAKNPYEGFSFRVQKFSLDDPEHIAEVETIFNRAITSKDPEVFIVSSDKFTFNSEYFIVLTYLEKVR